MKHDTLVLYLDGELTPAEVQQVEIGLAQDAELQKTLSELCHQRLLYVEAFRDQQQRGTVKLPDLVQKPSRIDQEKKPSSQKKFSKTSWGLIAASFVIFFLLRFYPFPESSPSKDSPVASLNDAAPGTRLVRADIKIPVTKGMEVLSHDMLITSTTETVIQYHDGTLIKIYPKSMFTVSPSSFDKAGNMKSLGLLRTGQLLARVTHQDPQKPAFLFTPDGRIEILGTELYVSSRSHSGTILKMIDGQVRFTRLSDEKTIPVTKSQWAYLSDKAEFIPRQGTSQLLKHGEPLLKNVFDSQFKQWSFQNAYSKPIFSSEKRSVVSGMSLIAMNDKMGSASIRLPVIQHLPSKAFAVQLEIMGESQPTKLSVSFTKDGQNVADSSLFQSYSWPLQFHQRRWYQLRVELDALTHVENATLVHVSVFRGSTLVSDHWLRDFPTNLSISTEGTLNVRNFQIVELTPDTIP
jgi:hypothetical protein